MQKWKRLLLYIGFSFMFLFISLGYAELTDSLNVHGLAEVHELKMVYIKEVWVEGYSSLASGSPSVTKTGTLTFEHSDYSLRNQTGYSTTGYGAGGSITISVTVKNNSGIDQYFGHHSAMTQGNIDKLKNNAVISYAQSGKDRLIRQGETKTFTFTIQNVNRNNALSMKNFESLLVFSPNFDDSATESATYNLAKIFANVLAGKGPAGDGVGITYQGKEVKAQDILGLLMEKMTSVDTGGYTGNVGNATKDEKDLIEAIFGDNIIIQLGDNYYSVYLLIKNQKVDNNNENDMVIYITADQLNLGSGGWQNGNWGQQGSYQNLHIVPVYSLIFIKSGNGYKYCDHLFAGEAPVCDIGGAFGEGKVGNFNTNLWNSTEFNVTDSTANGNITQDYINTNGELDEAYQHFINQNPGALINPDQLISVSEEN